MFFLRSISACLLYMKCSFCRFYLVYEVRKDAQSAGKTTGVDKILFEMGTDCLFRYFGYVKILEVSKNNSYPNGNKLLPCCYKAWRSAVYLCSSLEVLPCRSLSPPLFLLVYISCYLPRDIPLLSLKTHRLSVNKLVMNKATLDG